VLLHGRQQQEQACRPPALAAKHTEQLSAADAVGVADRTQSGPERRARTTVIAILAEAQIGTHACPCGPQAPSASGDTRHSVDRGMGHLLVGGAFNAGRARSARLIAGNVSRWSQPTTSRFAGRAIDSCSKGWRH